MGRARARARASARFLVCLIGFHFLILSLHLPSTDFPAPSSARIIGKLERANLYDCHNFSIHNYVCMSPSTYRKCFYVTLNLRV